jgi:hypothetical protein
MHAALRLTFATYPMKYVEIIRQMQFQHLMQ